MSKVQQRASAVGEGCFVTRATPRRVAARALIAVAVVGTSLACSEQNAPPVAPPSLSQAPSITRPATVGWNQYARKLVGLNRLNPLAAARVYAALAVAQFDAIEEADHAGNTNAEMERGAIVGASGRVLARFFPAAARTIDERVGAEASLFGATHPQFDSGLAVGMQAGTRMIARVTADHFTDPWTGTVPVGPGLWRNNGPPLGPLVGQMTSYLLTSGAQFRPPPPPAFGSAAFATDLAEIKNLSATRGAEQLESARFWNFPTGTPTPPGYWNQVAGGLVERYDIDERGAAHVFALMHAAMMDALIACWDAKYFYWYIRPSQADPTITLPIGLPNHPSYPSGHSCVSSAATGVLGELFPSEAGQLRTQLTRAGLSRMYGGIHYRFDILAGEALGRSVADWAIAIDRNVGLLAGIH